MRHQSLIKGVFPRADDAEAHKNYNAFHGVGGDREAVTS
jgi:hypothetical protein